MNNIQRRRPPFVRTIHPGTRDVRAFLNWDDAKASAADGRATVLLPPGTAPEAMDWTCCRGAEVWLRWRTDETAPDTVHRLAVAMVRAGAELVLSCETTGVPDCQLTSYRPREVPRVA
ncbi:MAG: hypothetical protein LJE69_09730 [Thiohalocapsa sp.]|jgi:hypothetical protein|uniref:hypothetical protein n=1 Tax=Thiohalocapsa sp. TaxID=2497641 RepID=UPI0025E107B3|nr:hypothetical protein [Thiohalocapsa sp.]MCG6941517.1 hypothetical protein [Thiohalocapsa sp.]